MLEKFNDLEIDVYDTEEFCPISRGQIRYVDFGLIDPASKDIGKCRPSIIIQTDEYNTLSDSTIAVVPLSKSPMYTCYMDKLVAVRIHGNEYPSILCTNTIKFVNKSDIKEYLCKCPQPVMDFIEEYIITRLFGASAYKRGFDVEDRLPGEEFENTVIYKQYLQEGSKIISSGAPITPEWVRGLSIAACKNFVAIVDILGLDYFKDTPKFNIKTAQMAVKTAKSRANSVIPMLKPTTEYSEEPMMVQSM